MRARLTLNTDTFHAVKVPDNSVVKPRRNCIPTNKQINKQKNPKKQLNKHIEVVVVKWSPNVL